MVAPLDRVLALVRDADGSPRQEMPRGRYAKAAATPLNDWGAGPFCRLHALDLEPVPGLYALCRGDRVLYVGKTVNLAQRFGPQGYQVISPKNCYRGGQATNCEVSHLLLREAQAGLETTLWILRTEKLDPQEERLIALLRPPWNGLRGGPRGGAYPAP